MANNLSLHQLSAMEIDTETLVSITAKSGFSNVCLFVEPPKRMGLDVPTATKQRSRSLRARMDDDDLRFVVLHVDAFVLAEETDGAVFEGAFAVAAGIGARSRTAVVADLG